jgi:hypothetical protein
MLKAEHAEASVQGRTSMRSVSGVEIAMAVLVAPKNARMSLRAFVGSEISVAISSLALTTSSPVMKKPID